MIATGANRITRCIADLLLALGKRPNVPDQYWGTATFVEPKINIRASGSPNGATVGGRAIPRLGQMGGFTAEGIYPLVTERRAESSGMDLTGGGK